jgi:hypothetical protein
MDIAKDLQAAIAYLIAVGKFIVLTAAVLIIMFNFTSIEIWSIGRLWRKRKRGRKRET